MALIKFTVFLSPVLLKMCHNTENRQNVDPRYTKPCIWPVMATPWTVILLGSWSSSESACLIKTATSCSAPQSGVCFIYASCLTEQ